MKITDLDESFGRRYHSYHDELQGRERDEERAMGRGQRDMSDESNLLYIYQDGRVMQKMVSNRNEREARAQGFRDTPEQALKMHGIIKSKFKPGKWVQKHGTQWVEVHPFGKPKDATESGNAFNHKPDNWSQDFERRMQKGVTETASAGATSSASIGTVDAPQLSPGKARGKKSYTGTPGHSGTKAPPQPKVVQPKTSAGTAVNALDMKANVFGQAKESTVIKRR